MKKLGFYFNMDACIGCRTCQIACKDKNNLEVGVLYRQVKSYEAGEYPMPVYYHISSTCNHCEEPACVAYCPKEAVYIARDGTVQYDRSKCDGCMTCRDACPYEVPQLVDGKMGKCDFCKDLLANGQNPACVDSCLQRCIEFGDLETLKLKYGSKSMQELPATPKASLTIPSTLIKPKPGALMKSPLQVKI